MKKYLQTMLVIGFVGVTGGPAMSLDLVDNENLYPTAKTVCDIVDCNSIPASASNVTEIANSSTCANSKVTCYRQRFYDEVTANGVLFIISYYKVTDCTSCSGIAALRVGDVVPGCAIPNDPNLLHYHQQICADCACDCPADTTWTDLSNGGNYSQRSRYLCSPQLNCQCMINLEYACNPGYYGKTESGLLAAPTCKKCPSSSDAPTTAGQTGVYGAQTIVECFLNSNTNFTDSSGTYSFTDICGYTE